jgi:hypothetical protein
MKCPKCQRNQRRGREGMTCKSCGYHFQFDPKQDSLSLTKKLNDHLFERIVRYASAEGTYQFTRNQLFSSARGFTKRHFLPYILALPPVLLFSFFMLNEGFLPGVLFCGFIGLILVIALIYGVSGKSRIKFEQWDTFVDRWIAAGRDIPGLIDSPALENPPLKWQEKDIYDYGVSGILLCNRKEIVDWLVLNHFHSQNNKLIMTPSGYPDYL